EQEVKALERYLAQGGRLFLMADPKHSPEVDSLLAQWGLVLGKGMIIDEMSFVSPDTASPVVLRGQYLPSPISEGVDYSYYPEATSVSKAEKAPKTVEMVPLAITSSRSWLKTGEGERKFDADRDTPGPLALGYIAVGMLAQEGSGEGAPQPARLVVIGDSDFASNQHFFNGGNSDIFLNSVGWLAEEAKLIGIRPKPIVFRRLVLGPAEEKFISYSSLGFLPLAVLLGGVIVWWRRR
ncbi:MAG: hypothetical protein Q8O76_06250, partial [Chloroflexota bacterium]|nr:hypothetical protein [Chloroflexota bacterium]